MENNKNWGHAPQVSDTGTGAPSGWGHAPQVSDTGAGAPSGWGHAPQVSDTGAAQSADLRFADVPEYPQFIIDGITYNTIRVISSTSGEAKILEIENGGTHFALKLYKRDVKPNHEVLDKVMKLRGNGLLIDIYAHGIWQDPKTGATHDYEIMQYCSGGSMATLKLTGDEKQMKEIAVRLAAALDFAHSHKILHRDVKPANLLYTDESRSTFVLTDWGLAKTLDEKGLTVTDEGRTKIYAAPEMYTYIPGQNTYLDAKADFFSMGMSLLALWLGEGILLADESVLVKNKQEERLPYPSKNEMSEHLLSLIKALTRRNPEKRAGMDEIVRWSKGEIIFKDAIDDSLREFKIVFSATDKLIAHNPKELGEIMWANKDLAKEYLYADEIYDWLKKVDYSELARRINNYTEIEYPDNQNAGLLATCLLLNPDTMYEGLNGKPLSTQKDIAKELLDNQETYRRALFKKDHPLWIYLSAKGLKDNIKGFRTAIRKSGVAGVRQIAYTLDSSLPYRFRKVHTDNSSVDIHTLEELSEQLVANKIYYDNEITENDFLLWLAHRNPALAGKAKEIIENKALDNDYRYYKPHLIIYSILPAIGWYDYKPLATTLTGTPEQIGRFMMSKIEKGDDNFFIFNVGTASKFDTSHLCAYLRARGKYAKQISWIDYCLDLQSADNKKKSGPYNDRIAIMKAASGLCGAPLPLHVDTLTFNKPEEVASANLGTLSHSQANLVADWLTLFFQEELNADYNKESYFNRLSRYFEFLKNHLPQCDYVRNTHDTISKITSACKSYENKKKRLKILKILTLCLGIIPLTAAIVFGVYVTLKYGSDGLGEVMKTVGTWVGIVIGIIVGLITIGDSDSLIIGAIAGFLTFILIKAGLTFIAPAIPWIILVYLLIQMIYLGVVILTRNPVDAAPKYVNIPLSEGRKRVEMGKAFNTTAKLLPPTIRADYPEHVYKENEKETCNAISNGRRTFLWLLVLTISAIAFNIWMYRLALTPPKSIQPLSGIELLDGKFTGNVKGTPLTVIFYSSDSSMKADMDINYRTGPTVQTMETAKPTVFPVVFNKTDNDRITLTIDTAYTESGETKILGSYLNSKGNRQSVNISKK